MTSADAKAYLSKREVPQLFECLMTALMYNRPSDHISFLQDCLAQIREKGVEQVRWNMFLEQQRARSAKSKTPLPPIESQQRMPTPPSAPRPASRDSLRKSSPLPPIATEDIQTAESTEQQGKIQLPDVPVIVYLAGPGSNASTHAQQLMTSMSGWVHVTPIPGADDEQVSKAYRAAIEKHSNSNAKGFLIEMFPRTMKQLESFMNMMTRCDLMLLVDCTDTFMKAHGATAERVDYWKEHCISVIRMFDNRGKLAVVDGEAEASVVVSSLMKALGDKFGASCPSQAMEQPATSAPAVSSSCPSVMLLMGGPGVAVSVEAQRLAAAVPGLVRVCASELLAARPELKDQMQKGKPLPADVAGPIVLEALKDQSSAKVILLEDFPVHMNQMELLESTLGDVCGAVLLDCNESTMRANLASAGCDAEAVGCCVDYWKEETITVARYLDAKGKLAVLDAEGPADQLQSALLSRVQQAAQDDSPEQQVEEVIEPTKASVEGDNGNPYA